jgi:divalent metal cation (Fe/Co/Zn/Cd) transporter
MVVERLHAVRRGRQLEYFTIFWNSLEALIALIFGLLAGSIALVGFGLDSLIEVTSGAALLWRLHFGEMEARRQRSEQIALRIVGASFLGLAGYVAYESFTTLVEGEAAERSIPGIVLAAVSLIVMPVLAQAKRRVAASIESAAMAADARQTEFCTYLSAILLGGLVLNAALGWWWADPVAGLVMVPIIAKEGFEGLQAKTCCSDGACH